MNSPADIPTPEAINALIGQHIKTIREKSGYSLDAVEKATGISANELRQFEAGRNKIPAERLLRLATFFNVTPDYFFEGMIQSSRLSGEDIHQLIQNFLKVEGPDRGTLFKEFVKAVTKDQK